METVEANSANVKADRQGALVDWLAQMEARGVYPGDSARMMTTAVTRLASVLVDDEPDTIDYLEAHLTTIAERWAHKNASTPGTARTYRSRAARAIRDFRAYREAPLSFRPSGKPTAEGKAVSKSKPKSSGKPKPTTSAADSAQSAATQTPDAAPVGGRTVPRGMRHYEVSPGHEVLFSLPEGGIKHDELAKLVVHLMTLCTDFEPSSLMRVMSAFRTDAGSEVDRPR